MRLAWLLSHFENSSSIGLLRARHAPYVIDFLYSVYKQPRELGHAAAASLGAEELTRSLRGYLDQIHQVSPEVLTDSAETYLADWCGSQKRYLRRFLEADVDEPQYELTSSTEDVLTFLDSVARREKQFVGTESRLKRIIETLADLAVGASENVEQRLDYLRKQRDELDDQIAALEAGSDVNTYHDTAIRERFAAATSDLVQLQGDFRAVEDRFKEITREVQKRQLSRDVSRGQILGEALDAEDCLKREDQGVSFNEFARLILSPSKQEQLDGVIRDVISLESLHDDRDGISRVRDMVPALTAEARKVLKTYQRLSATLRRLLDRDTRGERQRLGQVLEEIRSLAVQIAERPDRSDACSVFMEHELVVSLPLERPLWTPPTEFDAIAFHTETMDEDDCLAAFSDLAAMKSLDWNRLRGAIRDAVGRTGATTLADLLEQFEDRDVVDVLGLIQIAHEDEHRIRHDVRCKLWVQTGENRTMEIDVPEVTYVHK